MAISFCKQGSNYQKELLNRFTGMLFYSFYIKSDGPGYIYGNEFISNKGYS